MKAMGFGVLSSPLLSAVFYGLMSLTMNFINKVLVTSYAFNFPLFILSIQMLVTVVVLELLQKSSVIKLPDVTLITVKKFAAPSFFYAMHATLSLHALEGMNIPMYAAVKRCAPLVNLVLARIILKKPTPSTMVIASVVIIAIGCLVAGMSDPTFNTFAYTMGGLSVFSQALYLTLVQRCGDHHLTPVQILHLNSIISLIPFILLTGISGEFSRILSYVYLKELDFHLVFFVVIVFGLLLNYSLFLCTIQNSALTTSVVGVAKSVLQTVIGFFTFGGVQFHPINVIGICLNSVGSLCYSISKYVEHQEKKSKLSTESIKDEHKSTMT